jgi:hypothetical protein
MVAIGLCGVDGRGFCWWRERKGLNHALVRPTADARRRRPMPPTARRPRAARRYRAWHRPPPRTRVAGTVAARSGLAAVCGQAGARRRRGMNDLSLHDLRLPGIEVWSAAARAAASQPRWRSSPRAKMAEPEPQQQAPLQVDELGVPCLYIVGHEAEEPLSVRDLTAKLVGAAAAAAAPGDGGCRDWRVYIPPATADDATPVIELADLDELTELDGDDMQELEGQILSALVATTQAASSSSAGGGGGAQQLSQRKHPITLTSWCTLTPEEAGWTRALQAAATAAQPAVQDFVRGLSIFEIAYASTHPSPMHAAFRAPHD